jgi:hypothetical protein
MQALQNYVRAGGTLVAEACAGRLNEYGVGFQGGMAPEMQELFGVESARIANIREPRDEGKWRGEQRTDGDTIPYRDLTGAGATSLVPAFYLQTYRTKSASTLFRCGTDPAVCVNNYGEGRAFICGTLLGHAQTAYGDARNTKFLASIAAQAGIKPDRAGSLIRRRRKLGDKQAWFFINPTAAPVAQPVSLEGFRMAEDLLGSVVNVAAGSVTVRVDPLDIRCLILS